MPACHALAHCLFTGHANVYNVALKGALALHFTCDEEFGGLLGLGWLLEQKLTRPDFVIAVGFNCQIVTAHNTCLQLEITVHGKASRGAMPETGHAVVALTLLNFLAAV